MALPQGINFRATSGFVTDVSPATNEISVAINYPRTTPQGNTVGWEAALGNTRDRTTGNDVRLAGCAFDTLANAVYRIDLPSAGNYNVRAAFGDPSSVNATVWNLVDSSTVLVALATGTNVASNSFKDATNTVRTAAAWPASNAIYAATFATTICRVKSASAANNMIAHFYIEAASGGGTDTPVNPAVGSLALTGYSPTIARTANQAVAPALGSLAIAGYAPVIAQSANQSLAPSVGSLVLTGYAPSVAQSSATAVSPAVGTLTLTGYAPTITQPQAVAPGVGSLAITGYAPSVTQGITTNIAPSAGNLALSGYAPTIAQSANQSASPGAGTLAITGYAPSLTQTANQSVLPAVGNLAITGYAPTVAQAAASPSLTPDAGLLAITGYAPSITQSAPVTKIGGDDVPRDEDERIEIWEPRKPQPKRDDSLDKVVREAYAKAIGKPIAEAIAKPGPSVRAPAPDPFDYDEDDLEVLLLSY